MHLNTKPVAAPILMYHRIGPRRGGSTVSGHYVSIDLLEKQLQFFKRLGYTAMSLSGFESALREPSPGVKPLAITFDDAYESVFIHALPILCRLEMRATIFAVSGLVGKTNRWDELKGDVSERVMGAAQIREAESYGVEIGSHSLSHADLLQCSEEQAEEEIRCSKRILEQITGKRVDWFSYPYGSHDERIRSIVRKAGYLGACGTSRTLNTRNTDRFALARINMRATTTIPWLIYKLARARREMR